MATTLAGGFGEDKGSWEARQQGLGELARHANNGIGPEDEVSQNVRKEAASAVLGRLVPMTYDPEGSGTSATPELFQVPVIGALGYVTLRRTPGFN